MRSFTKVTLKTVDLLIILMMILGSPLSTLAAPLTQDTAPTIVSDKQDYAPGETVNLSGTDWNGDTTVTITVVDAVPTVYHDTDQVQVQADGTISDSFTLPTSFIDVYYVTATGSPSGRVATTTFTDANEAANLDQCANDPAPSPSTDGCDTNANQWENGNLGASKSLYFEGDSIPYRMRFTNLALTTYTVVLEWDTTKSGTHAIDYLTTFNRTVATANPCLGVSPCSAPTTFAIPKDGQVDNGSGSPITQLAGNFTLYGGTITSVSPYTYPDGTGFAGDKTARIAVVFSATQANPVLAWGGHISTRADWGPNNSAVAISGSPYHMRLKGLCVGTSTPANCTSGGNQDRSLSADAVIFPGSITIIKDAVPNDAQDFGFTATGGLTPDTFTLDDDSDGTLSNTQLYSNLLVTTNTGNNYTVVEGAVSGWTLSFNGTGCTTSSPNGGSASGDAATRTVSINLQEGENVTCTFINTRQAATLTLIKTVVNDNGGSATEANFQAYIDGNAVPWNSAQSVSPGSHTASESTLPGYTASSWGGDCAADGSVSLSAGQNKTCTITNDDQQAYITVVKVVSNTHGGTAAPDDFSLTLEGNSVSSGVTVAVAPGTYTAGETLLDGYTFEGFSGDCDNNGDITVALGESKTCTLTNSDQAASITVVKVVNNDHGGTADPDDFDLTLDGNATTSGALIQVDAGTHTAGETLLDGYTFNGFSGDCNSSGQVTVAIGETKTCTLTNSDNQSYVIVEKVVINDNGGSADPDDFNLTLDSNATTSGTPIPVAPGTYTAGETLLDGYAFEGFSGDCNDNGEITVALGETKTCTLTNNDQQAYIIVEKVVINDNGGSAESDDFDLTLEGNLVSSGVAVPVDPGTYTAGETLLAGYAFEGFSGDCDSNGDITVALGETKTCTLTNNDQQAYITVVKVVNNTHGGTAQPNDFNLTLEGSPVSSGVAVAVNPGTYTAGETLLPGYTFDGFSGNCNSSGDITVALGESKTCTLTNSDQQAYITVVKVVTNNNGGMAAPNDFLLSLEGNAVSSGVAVPVNPGTYTAGETLVSGYSFVGFSGDCNSNGDVTVALGQSKTCTLTNDDIAPILHLRKTVVNDNGGTKTVADFTLTANGTGSNDLSGTSPVDSGAGLKSDTWALSETTVYGYTASAWSCVGGTQNGSSITLGVGEEATCTITNDDQPGTIIVKKIIKPEGSQTSFSFDANGTGYNDFSLSANQTNSQSLNAGSYTVKELVPLGWTLTGIGGSTDPNTPYNCTVTGSGGSTGVGDLNTQTATISLQNGDTVTCVFENTGQGATRTQGFWATHAALARIAWEGGTAFGHTFPGVAGVTGIGDTLICGRDVDATNLTNANSNQLMGGFWSDISKKSSGAKRTALDQARMQLLQQLLAAELNASAFGSIPSGGTGMFAQWEAALCGTNQNAITTAKQQAASFNTFGDNTNFTPGTSADSRTGRFVADTVFWDIIKP